MADAFDLAMTRGDVVSTITSTNPESKERRVMRTENAPTEFTGEGLVEACAKGCIMTRRKPHDPAGNVMIAQNRGRTSKVTGEEARNAALAILGFGSPEGELTPEERGETEGANQGGQPGNVGGGRAGR